MATAAVEPGCGGGSSPGQNGGMSNLFRRSVLGGALAGLSVVVAACGGSGTAGPASTAGADAGFDVQGHRGARGLKPESTLPAFETALDELVTTLELDLHLTADGELVVWHDPYVDPAKCRLAGGAPAGAADPDDPATPPDELRISALTRSELGAYRCDRNPDPSDFPVQDTVPTVLAGNRFEIITLTELLDFIDLYVASGVKDQEQRDNASTIGFNIETKRVEDRPELIGDDFDGVNPGRFEQTLLDVLDERGLVNRVVVQSFDHRSLWAIRSQRSDVTLSALTASTTPPDFADLAARGASVWSPNFRTLDEEMVAAAHAAGLQVLPWTVNDVEEMRRLVTLGVDGLITDRPDLGRGL